MNLDQKVKSLSDFVKVKDLGEGAQGKVVLMEHKDTKELIACKIIFVSDSEATIKNLQNEILALIKIIDCDYLIRFYGAFYGNSVLAIPMEYLDNGSLEDLIIKKGKIPLLQLKVIAYQLLKGLKYLHNNMKIIHRDLKPANIMLNKNGYIKITDFGVSTILKTNQKCASTYVGSIFYMAPERINLENYMFNTDIWSFGCIILQCFQGYLEKPKGISDYNANEKMEQFYKSIEKLLNNIKIDKQDNNFIDFLKLCFKKYEERPSAEELLNHEIFKNQDCDDLSILKSFLK